jgi:hypothetical protein
VNPQAEAIVAGSHLIAHEFVLVFALSKALGGVLCSCLAT